MKPLLSAARPFLSTVLLLALTPISARSEPDLAKRAERVERKLEQLRGLKFRREVEKGLKSRVELQAYMLEMLAKEMPDAKFRELEVAFRALGFIKPDLKLKDTLVKLLTEQVAGFYDPETRKLYLITGGADGGKNPAAGMPGQEDMLMAHELTHALQDQHFDLKAIMDPVKDHDDRTEAVKSLVEGEATVTMFAHLMGGGRARPQDLPDIGNLMEMNHKMSAAMSPALAEAPAILTEPLMFSYGAGAAFVQAACRQAAKQDPARSWTRIDEIYADLPLSTEQIIHPEKYLETRDEPTELELPPLGPVFGDEWKIIVQNTLGELGTRILLTEFGKKAGAERAAAGWDGDRYVVLEKGEGGPVAFVWLTVWDDEGEAREFHDAYRKLLKRKYPDGNGPDTMLLERQGDAVLIYEGPAGLDSQAITETLWRTGRVTITRAAFGQPPVRKSGPSPTTPAEGGTKPTRFYAPHELLADQGSGFQILKPTEPWLQGQSAHPTERLRYLTANGQLFRVIVSDATEGELALQVSRYLAQLSQVLPGYSAQGEPKARMMASIAGQRALTAIYRDQDRHYRDTYIARDGQMFILRATWPAGETEVPTADLLDSFRFADSGGRRP